MKRLLLLRHAEALPAGIGVSDIERPLSPKGLADAEKLGLVMGQRNYQPDHVLCSPALRTRQTLEKILEMLGDIQTQNIQRLYDGSEQDYLDLIRDCNSSADTVMITGHNPVVHSLSLRLAKDDNSEHFNRLAKGYPPGSLAVLGCDINDWQDLRSGANNLTDFITPEKA